MPAETSAKPAISKVERHVEAHGRISGLDGLRGLSIALVVVAHAGFGNLVPGGFGVTIFFFISGFIISSLLLKELNGSGGISFRDFYIRRTFRILPVLFVYLAFSTIYVFSVAGKADYPQLMAALLFYYNYYFLWIDPHVGEFGKFHPYSIVWSLAVEEHFYLAFPLILYAFKGKLRFLLVLLVVTCLLVLLWRCYLVFHVGLDNMVHDRVYKSTDTRFDAIMFGVIFAISSFIYGVKIVEKTSSNAALALGMLLILISLAIRNDDFRESLRYTIQGVGLFLLFGGMLTPAAVASKVLGCAFFLYLGKISYSLYLWHWAVYVIMQRTWDPNHSVVAAGIMILLSIVIAHFSQKYIERNSLKWRGRFTSH